MKKKTILFFVISMFMTSIAFSQHVITDAMITFKIRNLGFNVDGEFSKSQIEADFSGANLSDWKLKGIVEINSINTDNKKRDKHLLETEYFNADRYPEMTLVANTFEEVADNFYNVEVDLKIKGKIKTITIPMLIEKTSSSENVYCSFEINRRDFEVGEGSLVMSNTVKIHVEYNLKNK